MARAARSAGAEVLVMTHVTRLKSAIEAEGMRVIPWDISRRSLNPFRELAALLKVISAYRHERPELVHHVALKPVVYGGLAARICGGIACVNAIAGLGHVFTSSVLRMRLLRIVLSKLLRVALKAKNAKTVLQNDENRNLLVKDGIVSIDQSVVIRGAGVDIDEFKPRDEPTDVPVVVLASRMLWEKGIREFVTAATKLRDQGILARFVLVGKPDPENPSSIPLEQIRQWQESRLVEYWGHQDDMATVFAQSNLVCLPSYLEGLPRVLIEAAACGRAIVATDVTGCREIVRPEDNGLLVPPRDSDALARALARLIKNPGLRARMGVHGRELVVREFSEEIVFTQTIDVYRQLLGARWPAYPLICKDDEILSESGRP